MVRFINSTHGFYESKGGGTNTWKLLHVGNLWRPSLLLNT